MTRRIAGALLAATAMAVAAFTVTALPGSAEAFPDKPIRVIVGFAPGGRTDTVARLLAAKIEEKGLLPQPLVIVNMPGGGGAVAAQEVLSAEPDGHTIMHWHHQMLIANAMGVIEAGPDDFASIGFTGGGSPVWTVRSDLGIETLDQLVEQLKAEPESLVEVIGIGTIPHFVGALLAKEAGFKTRKVQAGSGADRLKMIAGGNADISLFAASEYAGWETAGRGLDAVVFFGPNRIDTIPDVPTATELGYDVVWANPNWWLAPEGTPQETIDILAEALQAAFDDEEIKTRFAENSLDHYWTPGPQAHDESVELLGKLQEVAAEIR